MITLCWSNAILTTDNISQYGGSSRVKRYWMGDAIMKLIWVNFGSDDGLLFDNTEPSLEQIPIYRQRDPKGNISMRF